MNKGLRFFIAFNDGLAVMEERNRLARDLHDSAKQKAFAALAQGDKDKYIQEESKRMLSNLPDFE